MEAAVVGKQNSIFGYILQADPMVKFVLVALLLMSAACWAIIVIKYISLRRAQQESLKFNDLFWNSKTMDAAYQGSEKYIDSPLATIFRAGYVELSKILNKVKVQDKKSKEEKQNNLREIGGNLENIERSLRRAKAHSLTKLESMVPFLATTGSTAPFIGLFGTVWGIMNTFMNIHSKGATNIAVVAPGISEALIATAAGLFAAIPAVVFYNHFLTKIRRIISSMESFSADYLNIVKRNFFSE